jgi:serine protease Do
MLVSLRSPRRPVARLRFAAFAGALALSLALAPLAMAQSASPMVALPSFAPMVKQVMPAVVNISVTEKSGAQASSDDGDDDDSGSGLGAPQNFPPSPFDEMLRRFFDQQGRQGHAIPTPHGQRIALGSGFIIDPAGYVVTNNHVVDKADKVTVIFQDDSRHPAKVLGRDAKTDLALLKIETTKPLPFVTWGDSTQAQVGDWVLAVGNPFGLGGTVSTGIVSARGRDIHAGPYDDFLQIDASINRGNSGGPDFNLEGQVIGINTAIYSPNGGSVGIGFAIPSSLAKPVIEQLRAHGKVDRGWLGVQIQDVTPEIAQNLKLPKPEGALVADVTKGGPAEKIGIRQGDVIIGYNNHDIAKVRDLPIAVADTPVGQQAQIKLWRNGGELTVAPTIAAMPESQKLAQSLSKSGGAESGAGASQTASGMGLKLSQLTAELRREAHVPAGTNGVVVTDLSDSSPLVESGLQPGDVIVAINQEPVTTPKEVIAKIQALRKQKGGDKSALLLLSRHGVNQYVALSFSAGNTPG